MKFYSQGIAYLKPLPCSVTTLKTYSRKPIDNVLLSNLMITEEMKLLKVINVKFGSVALTN